MPAVLSTHRSRGGVEPLVGLAVPVRALGAATLVDAQVDSVAAAAERCEALVAEGVWR